MRIVAICKHVPDSRAALRVASDGSGLDTAGLKYACDPFDEIGLEFAAGLRAQAGLGVKELVAVSAGSEGSIETLRHALAMGADRAVHLPAPGLPHHDELAASAAYAECIRRLGDVAMVFCGARNTDTGAGELGPALAERLGWSHAGATTALRVGDGAAEATCRVEGGELRVRASLPVVISCERGLAEPHHPPLPKVMKAKKAPIETMAAEARAERHARLTALRPPASRPACRMIEGDAATIARELARVLREEARVV